MKLYHVADLHLGRRRLDGRLPDDDFVRAFRAIAEAAIADRAGAFVIAGDFFDRAQVEPRHLQQAQAVLRVLQRAGIAVIAVEGNHDRTFVHTAEHTWMQFVAEEELLVLLRPTFTPAGAVLEPWDQATRRGAWIEIEGVRFVGAGYLGAATPAKTRQILATIPGPAPIVLLLHAGPDYFVGEGGGFTRDDLRQLEDAVCYLALGHIHKPMRHGDWACNPGSPENCELREAGYDRGAGGAPAARGYAVVEIDPARPRRPVALEVRSNPRRPVHRVELDCTPFGNKTKHGAEALVAAAVAAIAAAGATPAAVIDLWLTGKLNLNRIALDQARACDDIRAAAGVFAVALDASRLNVGAGGGAGARTGAGRAREALERGAIGALVDEQQLWGLDGERDRFVELFYALKEAVRLGRTAEVLAEQIATSPLVEAVRRARVAPPATPVPAAAPAADEDEAAS
ncbi:MAG TPA: DNA repair exonuclease [Polyangia bacterium]